MLRHRPIDAIGPRACLRSHRAPALLLWGPILLIAAGTSLAQPAASPGPNASAQTLTQTLLAVQARYQSADPAERAQLEGELVAVAATRQQVLTGLVEADPAAVLRVAVPAGLRTAFPPTVQAYVEEQVQVEGVLEVLHEDRNTGSRYLYFLDAGGQRFSLHFAADQPALLSGTRVRVKGVRVGRALALASGNTSLQIF